MNTLLAWDVDHVFGMVGDGINPLIEALRKRHDKIRFIGVRHEEAAAFMASGWAKSTGRLGVCMATTGPGAVHLMNGLYDAHFDGAPVLAITGLTFHDLIGTRFMQSVSTTALMEDVALYNTVVDRTAPCAGRDRHCVPLGAWRAGRRASHHIEGHSGGAARKRQGVDGKPWPPYIDKLEPSRPDAFHR